jgi:isocitrate/isopropylmalate dehydrogenase
MITRSRLRFAVLRGDGIGPEITDATLHVLRTIDGKLELGLSFEEHPVGLDALRAHGTTFPEPSFHAARLADGILLGPVSHNSYPPVTEGGHNPSAELRRRLDLFANIRPARSRPGLPPRCGSPVDLVIVRENTEGFYADRSMYLGPGELMPTPDLALSLRKVTREGSTRIALAGFRLAARRRRKVTAVHKANVLRVSDGLFLECTRAVAAAHPEIAYEEMIIDAMAALLVRDASAFDVIVTTNMFGDILSDEISGLVGGLGLAPGANIGTHAAIFEAVHGTAPDLAGKGIANPAALIFAACMMLDHLHASAQADHIRAALETTIRAGRHVTRDLGGTATTDEFTDAIIAELQSRPRVTAHSV